MGLTKLIRIPLYVQYYMHMTYLSQYIFSTSSSDFL